MSVNKSKTSRSKTNQSRLDELNETFSGIGSKNFITTKQLIVNAVFMEERLADLRTQIENEGCVEAYANGRNQSGWKQSAAIQAYNQLLKNYNGVIKNLCGLLPKDQQTEVTNKLEEFMDAFAG